MTLLGAGRWMIGTWYITPGHHPWPEVTIRDTVVLAVVQDHDGIRVVWAQKIR